MNQQALYIHFEGMDLAGKSSTARNFVARIGGGWAIRKDALTDQNSIYELANSLRKANAYDPEVVGNVYVAALLGDIRSFKWPIVNTLQDSTIILRSYAYHMVRRTPRIPEILLDIIEHHPKFDASFLLTASIESRIKRLEKRSANEPDQLALDDLLVLEDPAKFLAMEAHLIDLSTRMFDSKIIETSELSADEVLSEIQNHLVKKVVHLQVAG